MFAGGQSQRDDAKPEERMGKKTRGLYDQQRKKPAVRPEAPRNGH
jgi:hypothetical protein